jgi:hypothetical protein
MSVLRSRYSERGGLDDTSDATMVPVAAGRESSRFSVDSPNRAKSEQYDAVSHWHRRPYMFR